MKTDIKWRKPMDWYRLKWPTKSFNAIVLVEDNNGGYSTVAAFSIGNGNIFFDGPLADFACNVYDPEQIKRFAIVEINT